MGEVVEISDDEQEEISKGLKDTHIATSTSMYDFLDDRVKLHEHCLFLI